jgi:type II secretory pathway pseudopilin PulG
MNASRQLQGAGFSLVEVIFALVLIAVAGAMLVTLVSRSSTQVNRPRETLSEALSLQSVMENIVARDAVLGDLSVLSAEIGSEGSAANNSFGVYDVLHNRFVEFDGANQEVVAVTTTNLLKVSIRDNLGETITRLFSEEP